MKSETLIGKTKEAYDGEAQSMLYSVLNTGWLKRENRFLKSNLKYGNKEGKISEPRGLIWLKG